MIASDGSTRPLFIDALQIRGGVRLIVAGELDMATSGQLAAKLRTENVLELDFADVTFMDSHALHVLIDAKNAGSAPLIVAASKPVRKLLTITGLGHVFLSRPDVDGTTEAERIVSLAVATIPGCSAASVTAVDRGMPSTLAATDERARAADAAQHVCDSGPCPTAARTRELVLLPQLVQGPGRYEEFRAAAAALGFASAISVPVFDSGSRRSALNLYGERLCAFDETSADQASALAERLASGPRPH